ncbi:MULTISPECIES: AraC family transcriptional regulator [Achromobacter]|uniref:AraC family transcriptional regulator n=3 Tax=Achromobacter aegrifaciens TaxID=1287736 RepID=A0ABU2DHV1_ACHAE|nr:MULTISPECIES: AraC family transcriptional regulator [Achromobacter]MBD9382185.1 AraC family transcriptional regulator [Achromobacter sp. ACM02]MDR7947628.1 AraC family transcriptional regulator [Achromobacter aegrifaciens]
MNSGQFVMQRSALAGVQAVAAHSRHAFARHTHEQFGIGVMRQGAQVSHSGRGQVEAGPGHVITVNPGEVHDGAPIGNGERAWQMLYLDPEVVAQAAAELDASGLGYEFEHPAQDRPALARDVLALYAQATAGAAPLACDALLLRILAQARDRDAERLARPARAAPDAIRHARALIDDDPAASLSLADLAAASGLSRYQVLRAFARDTGLTPHAYQVQRRLLLARSLIRQGSALADAAAAVGFADQSHMTRLFVRAYGVSPRRYALAAS